MATITLPVGTEKVRLHDSLDNFDGVAMLVTAALLPPKETISDSDGLAFFLTCEKIQAALTERVCSGAFGLTVPPLPVPQVNLTAAQLQNAMMTTDTAPAGCPAPPQ
jgi:hypothetical protein